MYARAYDCQTCQVSSTVYLEKSVLVMCHHCGAVIRNSSGGTVEHRPIPDDWSFIQIGTTGLDIDKRFKVIGRARLQLRNEYKNFWTIIYDNNTSGFLYESFGSFALLNSEMHVYEDDVRKLKAGCKIKKGNNISLTGEFVEKCEVLGFEGEIYNWGVFSPKFFVVQAGSYEGHIAVFHIMDNKNVHYFFGKKMTLDALRLENILRWNEWK